MVLLPLLAVVVLAVTVVVTDGDGLVAAVASHSVVSSRFTFRRLAHRPPPLRRARARTHGRSVKERTVLSFYAVLPAPSSRPDRESRTRLASSRIARRWITMAIARSTSTSTTRRQDDSDSLSVACSVRSSLVSSVCLSDLI